MTIKKNASLSAIIASAVALVVTMQASPVHSSEIVAQSAVISSDAEVARPVKRIEARPILARAETQSVSTGDIAGDAIVGAAHLPPLNLDGVAQARGAARINGSVYFLGDGLTAQMVINQQH